MHHLLSNVPVYTFGTYDNKEIQGKYVSAATSEGITWIRIQRSDLSCIILRESDIKYATSQN